MMYLYNSTEWSYIKRTTDNVSQILLQAFRWRVKTANTMKKKLNLMQIHLHEVKILQIHWINISIYDIKWISSCAFWIWKKQQTIPKNWSRYTKKTWNVKCNKTIAALHFVQYDVLWSNEKQYWPRPCTLVNIAFQCSITHHIALNEVQYT